MCIAALVVLGGSLASTRLAAQWVRYPTAGVPRLADGSVNMAAPTPRLADGKPDLSGTWTSDEVDPRRPGVPPNPRDATTSRRMINIGVDLPGGLPYQPWLAAIVKERTANNAKDDPHVKCLPDNFLRAYGMPHLLKFVHKSDLLVVLNEWNAGYRQVYTDARPFPEDPVPSWQGYSSAKWSGDTLVMRTFATSLLSRLIINTPFSTTPCFSPMLSTTKSYLGSTTTTLPFNPAGIGGGASGSRYLASSIFCRFTSFCRTFFSSSITPM